MRIATAGALCSLFQSSQHDERIRGRTEVEIAVGNGDLPHRETLGARGGGCALRGGDEAYDGDEWKSD